MIAPGTVDSFWEREVYSQGRHLNRYPFDCVVSFVFRHRPRTRPASEVGILEVGCGAANNLWFAAREGHTVAGIDGSASAIAHARQRMAEEGLAADLRVGDFTALPWEAETFDLAIDRCSLTCVGPAAQRRAVADVWRVLKPGGYFFYNAYSEQHASAAMGVREQDGRIGAITGGALAGVGSIYFSSRADLQALFAAGWEIVSWQHLEVEEGLTHETNRHAEWRIIARKV